MANPPPDTSWWDLIQQWKTGALTLIGIGIVQGIRMWVNDLKNKRDPETRAERNDKAEARLWLSQQDRRVRERVEQTDTENARLRARIEALETEVSAREADAERERTSGMRHYQKTVDIYQYVVRLVHDWRNGKPPPDEIQKFDTF